MSKTTPVHECNCPNIAFPLTDNTQKVTYNNLIKSFGSSAYNLEFIIFNQLVAYKYCSTDIEAAFDQITLDHYTQMKTLSLYWKDSNTGLPLYSPENTDGKLYTLTHNVSQYGGVVKKHPVK